MKNFYKIILIFLLVLIVTLVFYNYIFIKFKNKNILESESINFLKSNSTFSINKIILYSSAYGVNKNANFQQPEWILDLYQYTDIAIFINNNSKTLTSSNTIKKLYIDNIYFNKKPEIGLPSLFYLDSKNFGKETYLKNNIINDKLEFTVLNDSNKKNNIQTNTPVLFSDSSNPITLKYVNENIYTNFKLPSNDLINFNGMLLEKANIPISSLDASCSFDIVIVNNSDEIFSCPITINIPLSNNSENIYSGYVLEPENGLKYIFIKK